MGFILDPSKGINPNDARYYSYDPNPYLNPDFKVYERMPKPEIVFKKRASYKSNSTDENKKAVEQKLDIISKYCIDLSSSLYDKYIRIAFAFSSAFGESGREYFHAAVCNSSKYKRNIADKDYRNCLKSKGRGITLGTFFHYCKEYNI